MHQLHPPLPARMARRPRARAVAIRQDVAGRVLPRQPRPPRILPRHPLLRLLLINLVGGIAVALMVTAALLGFDVHGLGTLVRNSDMGLLAAGALAALMSVTFGAVAMATAVMALGHGHEQRRD